MRGYPLAMPTHTISLPFTHIRLVLLLVSAGVLAAACLASGCASARDARFNDAIARETPPADFQLGVTVQAPLTRLGARAVITPARDGRPATQTFVSNTPYGQRGVAAIPVSHRPARYVFEADWILRAAIGYGARETTFPPQTRQLTQAEIAELWSTLRASGLLDPEHPAIVSAPPEPEEIIGRTQYVVSYQVAGLRRTLVVDAGLPPAASPSSETGAPAATSAAGTPSPPPPPPAADADAEAVRTLIQRLAALAWQS